MENEQPVEVPSTDYFFERFRDAFTHSYLKFVATEAKEGIIKFCGESVIGTSLFYAFTPGQLESLIDTVFTRQHVRDFILTLTTQYYMRIDRGGFEWNTLVERLALAYNTTVVHALPSTEFDPKYRLMPNVYSDRLPEGADIQGYLSGNRWLVVIAMIDQCITIGDLALMSTAKPKAPK